MNDVAVEGDTVYSASGERHGVDDDTVRAIDAETGEEQWVFEGHDSEVKGVAVERGIVFSASEDGTVRAIDAETGTPLLADGSSPEGQKFGLMGVGVDPEDTAAM